MLCEKYKYCFSLNQNQVTNLKTILVSTKALQLKGYAKKFKIKPKSAILFVMKCLECGKFIDISLLCSTCRNSVNQ